MVAQVGQPVGWPGTRNRYFHPYLGYHQKRGNFLVASVRLREGIKHGQSYSFAHQEISPPLILS